MDFQPGDVVHLKSGGPKMTVEVVDEAGVYCTWFADAKPEGRMFQAATLKKVTPSADASSSKPTPEGFNPARPNMRGRT